MKKKLIFTAGGTGGHLFPAQAVASELNIHEILFVGAGLSQNRYFDGNRFLYKEISSATFSFSNPKKMIKGGYSIAKGVFQTKAIFDWFRPDFVIGFGSFFTLPVLLTALWQKVPFILHEQNAAPGKVNRLFSKFAKVTAITFPESKESLKGKVVEVAFPLRKKTESFENFGLNPELPILLLFGGSQGAQNLNALFLECAPYFRQFQIIHFTGDESMNLRAKRIYSENKIPHYVKTFEPKMDLAMKLASIAVTRSGASTIKELIEYELPAITIPFPFASEDHQMKNGVHFASLVGGGYLSVEKTLTARSLASSVDRLFQNRFEKKKKIQEYKDKNQLIEFSQLITEFLYHA